MAPQPIEKPGFAAQNGARARRKRSGLTVSAAAAWEAGARSHAVQRLAL